MTILRSILNVRSPDFTTNAAWMQTLVDDLQVKLQAVSEGGGSTARAKHTARGKLLPRERVNLLLDAGTPFLELSPMAAFAMYQDAKGIDAAQNSKDGSSPNIGSAPSAGLIAGIGRVSGIDCLIVCNDATVKGGTYFPMTVKKHLRAQEVAQQNNLP